MAKEFKNQKGLFEFTGLLSAITGIKKNETDENISRLELTIHDKDMESDVKVSIFPNGVAKYWDSNRKQIVEVHSRVEETMKEVKANNTGMPFGIEMKTPNGVKMYYVNDELISDLTKLKPNKFTVKIVGNVDFKLYNNRVQKNYTNIKSIEILTGKQKHGLMINFPIVISEMNKDEFVYGKVMNRVTGLVKTKLDNGQYAYKPLELGLDKDYFMKGFAKEVAKTYNLDEIELINNKLMPLSINSMKSHQGYVCLSIIGRLKVGEVVKKPTVDDLNPMEKVLLEIQGEKALKEKLDSMELIKEYFDSVILDSFNFEQGNVAQPINESELNLDAQTSTNKQETNPMLDVLNGIIGNDNKEETNKSNVEDIFGNIETKEEKSEDTAQKLEDFVNETESSSGVTTENTDSLDNDDFPFN